jgi:hypothetical protein
MRFADEPAERALSREITRADGADARGSVSVEKGELDRALERLTDAGEDDDRGE